MRRSYTVRSRWRLLALALLVGAIAAAGLGGQSARAARVGSTQARSVARPFCSACISQVVPADGSTATIDPDGKITISFTAQLNANFSKFVFSLDNKQIDAAQIQVMDTNPMQPTGQYRAALSAGQHSASIEADDVNGPAASFSWAFTAPPPPTPTPTAATAGSGSGGTGGASSDTGSGGFFTAKTLSILLFSIAGLGLLVMVFIAGMWYGGRRWFSKNP